MKYAIALIVPALLCLHARANLIVNGNFEAGTVTPNGQNGHADVPVPWTSSFPGNPALSFDTWHNDGTNGLDPTFNGVFSGMTAPEGVRWMGGWHFENMAQALASPLTPGETYDVSAYIRMSHLSMFWNGNVTFYLSSGVDTYDAPVWTSQMISFSDGWVLVGGSFVAPANAGSLGYFSPKFDGDNANIYMGIDDIRLTPAPGAMVLLGLGVPMVVARRRVRR